MSIKWIAPDQTQALPATVAPDESFTAFPPVTCELTTFEPASGTLYLSTYRLVFLESPSKTPSSQQRALKQLIVPLHRWHAPTIGQPWFGPNFYEGVVKPLRNGGLDAVDATTLRMKFVFKEGGIEHFHKALEAAYTTAKERHMTRGVGAPEGEDLPVYEGEGQGVGVPPTYD